MADDRWGHVKWLPGTAGDQAWCRRDPPVLQPELQERSGPGSMVSPNSVSLLD